MTVLSRNHPDNEMSITLHTDRLRAARKALGLTQQELAALCGLNPKQIHRYEHGLTEPSAVIVATIAHHLGVSVDYLCGLTDVPGDYVSVELRPDERKLLEAYSAGDMAALVRLASERLRVLEGGESAGE